MTGTLDVRIELPDYKPKKILLWLQPYTLEETELLLACVGKPISLERRGNGFTIEIQAP